MNTEPFTNHPATNAPAQATAIDWDDVRLRAETTLKKLAQGAAPSPEERRSILKTRARALAREPQRVAAAQEFLEIIDFRLGSETYGIEAAFVRDVLPLKDYTALPGAPSFVLGVINARGEIISVVDLKKFFNLPEKGLGQLNKVVILRNAHMEFGVLADDILGAHPIAIDTIQAAPSTVTGIGASYLRGVTADRVIIIDAEKILGDDKIIVHQAAD
jgi:purine-binding chemotaxis protein CheW